ncbi:MAG: CotH kinase family protein [Bacteroidales bacterium]|nr:CotH kinase family protein [Bacteroidales bacterium]
MPTISFEGEGKLVLHDTPEKDINTITDFARSIVYDVIDEETKDVLDSYEVNISNFTGLPVMWIETENRTEITSKEDYINATYRIEDSGSITEGTMKIKGRGNSTWSMAPKKPYALKLDEKTSLLGEAKDKSWVLLANYFDLTMLRNRLAFYMGYISNLDYTAKAHFVEVFLNGKYNGTYQLCEKLKIGKNRVNVGDDGFLMEIDSRAPAEGDPYFTVPHLITVVNIKDPDVTVGDENFTYAQEFLTIADAALFSEGFKDPENGWQKFMDITSFVDFFIINEIAKNADVCSFYTSCYMNLKRGGKLKMGPIWDFDNAFGKHENIFAYPVEGWYLQTTSWYRRLFEDPAFISELKKRYAYFYSRRNDLMMDINNNAEYLRYAVDENNARWGTLYNTTVSFNYNVWGSYQNEVYCLKDWLNRRMEWLNTEINKL